MSPGFIKLGYFSFVLSNNFNGVLPIIFHPPGLWFGYMPVCLPPIPTAPLETFNIGDSLRGWYNLVSNPSK